MRRVRSLPTTLRLRGQTFTFICRAMVLLRQSCRDTLHVDGKLTLKTCNRVGFHLRLDLYMELRYN